ncbi:MAG: alpha/beta hydrolase-fold protein [Lactimicrobium massiliense]|nr:alpha/beta hydrolase-fold protein [Lactimicrobium massiliense]MDD6229613.1 alpha/beta hydrolase-fold protein [Lactimicrobium massiliense]MDD6561443.1 alpha/beta hydrolase-fold protein [Lactimicrobium massiliense]
MAFSYLYNVPHGAVISQMYFSSVTGRQERCMIYTPPGYQKDSQDYPVLYLLHGASDNETSWFTRARLNSILDNLLAEQKCVPFIVVAINDMYTGGKESADRKWEKTDGTTETVLIHDCIPFIESQYRVKTDQPDRAIGGLSLGALEACDCGSRHPELFGSMGFLTSILEHESYENALGRPWVKALQHPEKIMENYRLIFCSATPQEDHFPYFLNDAELFRKAGIEEKMSGYVRIAHDGRFTRWDSWRMGIRDFAVRLFRD